MTSSERFLDAARKGDAAALREGVTWKDYDRPDDRGMTPAMWAAASGHVESLRVLAERGASVNRCDYLGRSALHHAAGNGHVGCVVFLVAFGANIWALDNNFNTPLDAAASHNRMAVVRRLEVAAADQMYDSIKTVKKQRATAIRDAEKRARRFLHKSHHQTDRLDSGRAFRGCPVPEGEEARPGTSPSYVSLTLSSSLSGRSALSDLRPSSNERLFPYSPYFEIDAAPPLTANSSSSSSRSIDQSNGATNGPKNGSLFGALARKLQRKPRYLSTFASEPALNCGERESPTVGLHKINGYTAAAKSTSRLYTHRTNLDIKGEISKPNSHRQQPRRPLTPFHVGQSAEIVVRHVDESLKIEDDGGSPTGRQFWIQRNVRGNSTVQVSDDRRTGSRDAKRLDTASKSVDQTSVPETKSSAVIVTADHRNSGTFYESGRNTNAARFPERIIESGLEAFLRAYGLLEYITVLTREKLDMNSLVLVDDLDLKELGIPLGPRRILLDAIAKRRTMPSNAGRTSDIRF